MSKMETSPADFTSEIARTSPFSVEDVFWGYKIRSRSGAPFAVIFGQAVCFFLGVCLLAAAIGVLLLPTLFFDGGVGVMRVGSAVLMGAAAAYLLWFASRGTQPEVHVDTSLDEIREVVCNRAGKPTIVSGYSFDEIGGVHLEEDEKNGQAQLLLGYRDTPQTIRIAVGTEAQLMPLRDRLANDLLGLAPARVAKAS